MTTGVTPTARRTSSTGAAVALWVRLNRHQRGDRLPVLLAVVGFMVATAAALTTLAGALALVDRGGEEVYAFLALTASVILVVPIAGLAAAVTRLAVSRRNARLAALRLAGATTTQVGLIATLDAVSQALVGALLGVLLYAGALPGVALIRFQGRAFDWTELWLGAGTITAVVGAVVLLALFSALTGLGSVAISPLGVAQRRAPARVMIIRAVGLVLVLLAWGPVTRAAQGTTGLVIMIIVVGLAFAALNLVGPLVLRLIGMAAVALARRATTLVAARRLLDDPRGTWRTISGVTLATFVAGLMSVGPAMSAGLADDPESAQVGADLLTGSVVTLVIAGLLAAASAGVTQAARVLDQRDDYRMLHLAGTEVSTLQRIRLAEVALPLITSIGLAAAAACLLIAPFGLPMIVSAPQGLMIFVGGALGAVAVVLAAVLVSNPLITAAAYERVRTAS